MLSLYIDQQDFSQSFEGAEDVKQILYYQPDIRGYIEEITGQILLVGGAYNYCRNLFVENICHSVDFRLMDGAIVLYRGIVYLSDVRWNITKRTALIEVTDNGLMGLIDNNRQIEANVSIGTSKNGVPITPAPQYGTIGLVSPDSSSGVNGRQGYLVYDVLKFFIQFMTDGEVSLLSDFFNPAFGDSAAPQKNCVILNGNEIRLGDQAVQPIISFGDLFIDLAHLFDLRMVTEQVNGVPYIRIEDSGYFTQSGTIAYSFQYPEMIEQSLTEGLFNAAVRFGSYKSDVETEDNYLQQLPFLGHRDQSYHLSGQCNLNTVLDLRTQALIYETNIIQDVLPVSAGGSDNSRYDDDVFILHIQPSVGPTANNYYGVFTPVPYNTFIGYYNATFSPFQLAPRHYGSIPYSIYGYLGGTGGLNAAGNNGTATQLTTSAIWPGQPTPLQYSNITADPGSHMNFGAVPNPFSFAGAFPYYEASVGGLYRVTAQLKFMGRMDYVLFVVFDSLGNEEYTSYGWSIVNYSYSGNGIPPEDYAIYGVIGVSTDSLIYNPDRPWVDIVASKLVPVSMGSRVAVVLGTDTGEIWDSSFTIESTFSGQFQEYSLRATDYMTTMFSMPTDVAAWESIRNARFDKFNVLTGQDGQIMGNMAKITRTLLTEATEIELAGAI